MMSYSLNPPQKLCIIRLSAIGDVIHSLAVINTIKSHWQNTEITWIIGKTEYSLLDNIPGIRFIPFNKSDGIKAYWQLYTTLRNEHFDILLLMQISLRANLASLCVKAPIRIGFDAKRSKDLHGLFINQRIPSRSQQHVMDGLLEFTRVLGMNEPCYVWDSCCTEKEYQFVRNLIPKDNQDVLLISPCSSHRFRNWTTDGYASIADYAVQQYKMHVILTGNDNEISHRYANTIKRKMSETAIDMVGKTSLKQLMALLERADVVISPDSGPAHMANSVGTPVIGLYAATNPSRVAPYFSRQWCVNRYPEMVAQFLNQSESEIAWGRRYQKKDIMSLITVADVKQKLDQLLA